MYWYIATCFVVIVNGDQQFLFPDDKQVTNYIPGQTANQANEIRDIFPKHNAIPLQSQTNTIIVDGILNMALAIDQELNDSRDDQELSVYSPVGIAGKFFFYFSMYSAYPSTMVI